MEIHLITFNAILTELDRDIRNHDEAFDPAIVYSPLSDFSDIERTLDFDSDRLIKEIQMFVDKQRIYSALREIHHDHEGVANLRKLNLKKDEHTRQATMLKTLLTYKKKKGFYAGHPLGMQANTVVVKPIEFQEATAAKNYYMLSHDQIAAYEFSFTPVEKIKNTVEPELEYEQEQLLIVKQTIANVERDIFLEIPDALEEKLKNYGYL